MTIATFPKINSVRSRRTMMKKSVHVLSSQDCVSTSWASPVQVLIDASKDLQWQCNLVHGLALTSKQSFFVCQVKKKSLRDAQATWKRHMLNYVLYVTNSWFVTSARSEGRTCVSIGLDHDTGNVANTIYIYLETLSWIACWWNGALSPAFQLQRLPCVLCASSA